MDGWSHAAVFWLGAVCGVLAPAAAFAITAVVINRISERRHRRDARRRAAYGELYGPPGAPAWRRTS